MKELCHNEKAEPPGTERRTDRAGKANLVISRVSKLTHREVKLLAQGHTADKWQRPDSDVGLALVDVIGGGGGRSHSILLTHTQGHGVRLCNVYTAQRLQLSMSSGGPARLCVPPLLPQPTVPTLSHPTPATL